MTYFRNTVAVKCGINAAIVAEIIWELQKTEFDKSKTVYHRHRRWCRCSQPMITLICPALSVHKHFLENKENLVKNLSYFVKIPLRQTINDKTEPGNEFQVKPTEQHDQSKA